MINKVIDLNCIPELICDEYGNYVVQVMLGITKETNENKFQMIISGIRSATKNLLQTDHGRKILDKLSNDYSLYFKNTKKNKASKNNNK